MVKSYHSYTKDKRFLIADMHPSHIVNALAVINEGRHKKYFVGDPVYQALVEQLLVSVKEGAKKRAAAKAHQANILAIQQFGVALRYAKGIGKTQQMQQAMRGYADLDTLRSVAKRTAKKYGYVAADNLRYVATEILGYRVLGLDICSVFRTKDFVFIGRKRSASPSANGRSIQVYILG
jgi:hypothetical protein